MQFSLASVLKLHETCRFAFLTSHFAQAFFIANFGSESLAVYSLLGMVEVVKHTNLYAFINLLKRVGVGWCIHVGAIAGT